MQAALQLFTASSGKLSAKVTFDNNTVRHLHSTVMPEVEAYLYENMQWYGDLIVFAGIGLGWHISRILAKLPAHAACIVIDYFEECITHSREALFGGLQNRVFFITAAECEEKKDELFAFIKNTPPGSVQIVKHPASFDCFRDFYETLLDIIILHRNPGNSNQVKTGKKALTFFGNFFLEEEVRRALAANKIEPVLFEYKKYAHGLDYESSLSRLVQEEKPDFILSINMMGFDGNGQTGRMASRFGLPLVVWFVDDPRPILLNNKTHLTPHMTAFCWEKAYLQFLRDTGFARVEHLPLACDPGLFRNAAGKRPTTPLGFVGTSMIDKYAGNIRDKFLWSDALLPLALVLSEKLCSDPTISLSSAIPKQAQSLGISIPFSDEKNLTWLAAYIIHLASMKKRKAIVGALVSQGIETFGDPDGWKELLGSGIITHSNIDYRHELGAIYQSISVNINITSCQMPTAVNQRVFDIPMAGSFVISDRQKDLFDLFDPQEVAAYETIEDLQEKTRFYLTHEAERLTITRLAQKRILAEHTYVHRVKKIISLL
jgi:spore maturation protein CgeB